MGNTLEDQLRNILNIVEAEILGSGDQGVTEDLLDVQDLIGQALNILCE